jgi:hypothetical protein
MDDWMPTRTGTVNNRRRVPVIDRDAPEHRCHPGLIRAAMTIERGRARRLET